jgi:voltage-gated potassium channel
MVLAGCFIAVYAAQVAAPSWSPPLRGVLAVVSWMIWGIFAVDLGIRTWLADRRGRYLLTHPIDVLMVLLPALRPLRVLRVFTAGQALVSRGGRLSLVRSTQAIAAAAGLLVFIAALAALDAERTAVGSQITSLGDALWWAASTVTIVGYGDTVPVTGTGRLVAGGLMLVGISLVGAVTASVAAWFIAQTRDANHAEEVDLAARLTRIEVTLAQIQCSLRQANDASPPTTAATRTGMNPAPDRTWPS